MKTGKIEKHDISFREFDTIYRVKKDVTHDYFDELHGVKAGVTFLAPKRKYFKFKTLAAAEQFRKDLVLSYNQWKKSNKEAIKECKETIKEWKYLQREMRNWRGM